MFRKILTALLVFCLAAASPVSAFSPTEEQLAAMELDGPKGRDVIGDNYKVYWNQDSMLDTRDKRSAKEIAESFIGSFSKELGLQEGAVKTLKVEKILETDTTSHVVFQQYFQGCEVEGATLRVSMDSAGAVRHVTGHVVPAEELDYEIDAPTKEITEKMAIEAAKKHIGLKTLRHAKVIIKKIRFSIGAIFIPCFKIQIMAKQPLGDYCIIVNAATGEVMESCNQMVFITGNGTAYPYHPLKGGFEKVDLNNLAGKDKLSGKYINIINDDGPGATSTDASFHFEPADTHFDEVGMYYYMNLIHDYFSGLGFNKLNRPLNATVHYGDNYDNAYFSPWGNEFCFGDGSKLNNLAREESVAYHEYTHAVTSAICNLAYKNESGAMNEGWSDYFACTQDGDPKIGEWVMAKLNRPWMRNLSEFKKYPDDIQGEVHADGKIWGSVLWTLRTALGKDVSDKIIHKGRYYINNYNAKFVEGLDGILEADEAEFGGKHKDKILDVFAKHGIKPIKANTEEVLINRAFNEGDAEAIKKLEKR